MKDELYIAPEATAFELATGTASTSAVMKQNTGEAVVNPCVLRIKTDVNPDPQTREYEYKFPFNSEFRITDATNFYFSVPAGVFSTGFTVTLDTTDGTLYRTARAANTIKRSVVKAMHLLDQGNFLRR